MKIKLTIIIAAVVMSVGGALAANAYLNRYSTTEDGTRLPKVTDTLTEGLYPVIIPNDPKPVQTYSQTLKPGSTESKRAEIGDIVSIHFQVVSWESGETREATRQLVNDPIQVEAGLDNAAVMRGAVQPKCSIIVPQHLSNALVGTVAGERKLVIFPENTADLPVHLAREDAYALVVDVVAVH